MSDSSSKKCAKIKINGMTCHSCEVLIERKLRAVPGVTDAQINYRTGIATISADKKNLPSSEKIEAVIKKAGYSLADNTISNISSEADSRKWFEIGGSLLIIFVVYRLLLVFDLVSLAPSTSGVLSLGGVFVIGLVAGTSSCLAVTGGLLLALAAKHNQIHRKEAQWKKFALLMHFNVGRLVSYAVLGGLVGLLGQSVTLSTQMSGYMSIAVALIMLYLALTILRIIPAGSFPIRPPKKLAHWIHGLSESDHPAAPFTLGAFTFFLPCGFTQSLQLVALASGNFITGALVMFTFALGTLPSLIGLSVVASAAKGTASRLFLRFSGALVLILAIYNLNSGLALTGLRVPSIFQSPPVAAGSAPKIIGGMQEVSMKVTRSGYMPNNLTITAGVPVRWKVDGTEAAGCTSVMTIPSLNVSQPLQTGENIIEFTPLQKGQLAFMCSMGMVRGSFTVL